MTKDLQYSSTPYQEWPPFDIERDCGVSGSGRCIVTCNADSISESVDVGASADTRRDALRLLIHLIEQTRV